MSFVYDDDQELLRRTVREFLADHSSEEDVRRLMETDEGYDPKVWRLMAEQLGLQGLAIPEELGGSGFGLAEVGLVFEEMGRVLLCAPYFSTVAMATPVLLGCADTGARNRLLPEIAAGRLVATLAVTDDSGVWTSDGRGVSAQAGTNGTWQLIGHRTFVLDGHLADLILVVARDPDGTGVFVVEAGADGLTRTRQQSLDRTRKFARLEFEATPATRLAVDGDASDLVDHALRISAALLSMEMVGGAARAMEMAVGYCKVRRQFGRLIGSFQALKHRCADLLVTVESARSAAYHAIRSAADGSPEFPAAASLAKAYCADAYSTAAVENIQLHGGIGFTWEHPAHLYFRRAKSAQAFLGDSEHHREIVAEHVGL